MNSNMNVSKKIYISLLKNNATFKTQLFDSKFDGKNSDDNDNEIHLECILGFK